MINTHLALAKYSISIIRLLIHSGTVYNLPSGLKAHGMRVCIEDSPLQPGEIRDLDTTGGSMRLNLISLPIQIRSNSRRPQSGKVIERVSWIVETLFPMMWYR